MTPAESKPSYREVLFGKEDGSKGGIVGANVKSVVISEVTGMAVSYGFLQGLYKLFPEQTKRAKAWIGKHLIEPNMGWLQVFLDKTGSLHTLDEQTKTLSKEKDVELLTDIAFETVVAAPLGWLVALKMHQYNDTKYGLLQNSKALQRTTRVVDAAVHCGAVIYMNNIKGEFFQQVCKKTSAILQKVGVSKERADHFTRYVKTVEGPNLIAAGAALAATIGMSAHATRNAAVR